MNQDGWGKIVVDEVVFAIAVFHFVILLWFSARPLFPDFTRGRA